MGLEALVTLFLSRVDTGFVKSEVYTILGFSLNKILQNYTKKINSRALRY